jgi:diguanylate cyclase (GGDEF)-like protein/PAS domain S-box-containing protein
MSVRLKTLIISIMSFLLFVVFTNVVSYQVIDKYINRIENKTVDDSFDVVTSILNKEENNIKSTSLDWAHWDETYNFLENKNEEYIRQNIVDNTMQQLKVSFIYYIDQNNDLFYKKTYMLENEERTEIEKKLLNKSYLGKINPLSIEAKKGIVSSNNKLYIVSIAPITTSDERSKPNGKLIIGRVADNELLNYINTISKSNIKFLDKLRDYNNKDELTIKNNGYILASKFLKDINGNNSIEVTIDIERYLYNIGLSYLMIFGSLYIAALLIVLFLDRFVLDRFVLKRLKVLDSFIGDIRSNKDTSSRILLDGNDEFSNIAQSTNSMLEELALANIDIKDMNERFTLVMEATKDGYFDLNIEESKLYINEQWKQALGYEAGDDRELFHEHFSKIHPECLDNLRSRYGDILNRGTDFFDVSYRMFNNNGDIVWVSQRGKIVDRDVKGNPLRLISVLINITERKKYEDDILFLSYSDKLTGLKNRAYMEKELEELDRNHYEKYFLIMGDVNGLKLINDALGHKEGDKLIYNVSKELKILCSNDDIVSRWGGDEFVILIKDKNKEYVEGLITKIKVACNSIKDFPINVSIALGYANIDEENMDSEAVMSVAEKRMYRNKLIEKKSTRNAVTSSLLRTLHEKHSETEEHTMRIKEMSYKLGTRLGLSKDKLDELELLGLLHDIGKIGIPEHILLKPSKLTGDEWEVMKTHTEIGYRIAKSTPELSHIADEILAHHERYDGTGYPNGWKGEEIPLLARIINVIDSFDVMTHKREYKEAKDIDYAVEELKKCSSKQFDPILVEEFLRVLEMEGLI